MRQDFTCFWSAWIFLMNHMTSLGLCSKNYFKFSSLLWASSYWSSKKFIFYHLSKSNQRSGSETFNITWQCIFYGSSNLHNTCKILTLIIGGNTKPSTPPPPNYHFCYCADYRQVKFPYWQVKWSQRTQHFKYHMQKIGSVKAFNRRCSKLVSFTYVHIDFGDVPIGLAIFFCFLFLFFKWWF